MNIKEFEVRRNKPFEVTLMYELYEDSEFDKKAGRLISDSDLFADSKMNNEVFYYDITNQTSLRKYLSLGMDKETIIYMIRRMIKADDYFEQNGIDKSYLMFDADLTLVDKESEEMTFITVPAQNHGLMVKPLRVFIREILASTVYAEDENLDYVGRLLTFINSNREINKRDLENVLGMIEASSNQKTPKPIQNEALAEDVTVTPVAAQAAASVSAQASASMPVSASVSESDQTPAGAQASEMSSEAESPAEDDMEQADVSVPEINIADIHISDSDVDDDIAADASGDETAQKAQPDALGIEMPEIDISDIGGTVKESAPQNVVSNAVQTPSQAAPQSTVQAPSQAASQSAMQTPIQAVPQSAVPTSAQPASQPGIPPYTNAAGSNIPVMKKAVPYLVRSKSQEMVEIDKDEFKIGKIPGMADFLLSDNPAVSRMHAVIHHIDGSYFVCDNYSTNHTYLNGERLEAGKNYLLINGAKVSFANDEFTFLNK